MEVPEKPVSAKGETPKKTETAEVKPAEEAPAPKYRIEENNGEWFTYKEGDTEPLNVFGNKEQAQEWVRMQEVGSEQIKKEFLDLEKQGYQRENPLEEPPAPVERNSNVLPR